MQESQFSTEHTPGPWRMLIGSEFCFHDTTRVAIIKPGEGDPDGDNGGDSTIAEVWPADHDTDIADGRLIAAAPDLLAAAIAELEYEDDWLGRDITDGSLDDYVRNGGEYRGQMAERIAAHQRAMSLLRSAIAKARGE